ncbi:MAG: tRNA pseudouridine synthase [Acidobacteriaceae bacterium]|nr:tRNA pseudouridine synthase [Acidobacteriaceae bacterium]
MPLWKTILSYDGTSFHGWQVQPSLATVQGTLACAIHHVTGETVLPQGSGRTDTGVHALGQVASFNIDAPIPASNLHRALNRALPPSVRIVLLEEAPPHFHARHSAVGKTYEYRIFPARPFPALPGLEPMPYICSPMLAPYVWDCPLPLDPSVLQNAADAVLGTHDFTSFAASDPDATTRAEAAQANPAPVHQTNIRTIHHSDWTVREGLLIYTVSGNGFLHHMVRNLVGTFVEAGCGRIPAESIATILSAKDRSAAGPTAPASGLFLMEVFYPNDGTSH